MAYKAPIWEDGKSPAISAENLNNLSQAAEGAQVLYGNSAPTSSTEGAVGQFYLVVVADSDGSYPLYQCVAIANGSYVWRDTRSIPDSIALMLGISGPGTINSALNVLANVGNLHVWEEVQSGATDYLTSTDRLAYPNYITDGHGAYITYLGQLGGGARIEVGSYVGTGTYGSSNPCSVTASFPIKQLSVFGEVYANTGNYFPIYQTSGYSSYSMHDILLTTSFASRRGIHNGTSNYGLDYSFGKKSVDGRTFWWYSSGNAASLQLNETGSTYYYIAIG